MTSLIRYAMIWRRWRLFIAEGVQQRQAANRAIARMKHRLLSSCFETWVEETKRLLEGREQVLALATARMLHLELASAFIRWAELGARYAKAKLLQRRVLTQLLKGILADVFYAWAEAVGHEAARQATLLRKALNWMFRSYLVHSFDAWNVFQAKSQEARAAREEAAAKLARQLVLRWQGSMLHKLFRVWESANRERRALLRRVADAIGPLMTTDDH
jgi:hypothetical protein